MMMKIVFASFSLEETWNYYKLALGNNIIMIYFPYHMIFVY